MMMMMIPNNDKPTKNVIGQIDNTNIDIVNLLKALALLIVLILVTLLPLLGLWLVVSLSLLSIEDDISVRNVTNGRWAILLVVALILEKYIDLLLLVVLVVLGLFNNLCIILNSNTPSNADTSSNPSTWKGDIFSSVIK
jgi:hypothetical protein